MFRTPQREAADRKERAKWPRDLVLTDGRHATFWSLAPGSGCAWYVDAAGAFVHVHLTAIVNGVARPGEIQPRSIADLDLERVLCSLRCDDWTAR